MIMLCMGMVTYIFAATKSELLVEGQIGYVRPKGTGTEEDPFLIYDVGANDGTATQGSFNYYAGKNSAGVNYFASSSPQYYFKQANDISGSDFTQTTLLGFYDGNNYEFIATGSNKAIFSAVGSSSVTSSLLENLSVYNANSTDSAGVVVSLYGTIEKVSFSGALDSSNPSSDTAGAGGIVSFMYQDGIINLCKNFATIDCGSRPYVGGICGLAPYGSMEVIKNCANYGNVVGSGIIGYTEGSYIRNCANYGNITGSAGICLSNVPYIDNCVNYGKITNGPGLAGRVGFADGYIKNSYNLGSIEGSNAAIVTTLGDGTISSSYWLDSCGAIYTAGDNTTYQPNAKKTLTQLQTQSTYSGWTFGTYGTATDGWVFAPAEILVNGETEKLILPRLWWEDLKILETTTLSFNAGSGSGSMVSQTIITGVPMNIKANEFTPPANMVLAGWATSQGGSVVYAPDAEITISTNITLYAVWKPEQFTVTFDKRSGTGGTDSVTVTYGSSMPSATAPTRTGCIFSGYYTDINGGGTQYYNSSMQSVRTWDLKSNTTLYAYWILKTYTITLNANGGSFGGYTVSAVSGAGYGFALNANGYYESQNKAISNSAAVCRVDFSATAGSTVVFTVINYAESSYDYGLLSSLNTTMSTSYSDVTTGVAKSFSGSQSASTQTYSYSIPTTGNHFVYVKFRKDGSVNNGNDSLQFKITSGLNSSTTQTITVSHGVAIGSLPTPTRAGNAFNGWFTATSGGTQITSSSTFSSNTTIFAQWTVNTYKCACNNCNNQISTGTYCSNCSSYACDICGYCNSHCICSYCWCCGNKYNPSYGICCDENYSICPSGCGKCVNHCTGHSCWCCGSTAYGDVVCSNCSSSGNCSICNKCSSCCSGDYMHYCETCGGSGTVPCTSNSVYNYSTTGAACSGYCSTLTSGEAWTVHYFYECGNACGLSYSQCSECGNISGTTEHGNQGCGTCGGTGIASFRNGTDIPSQTVGLNDNKYSASKYLGEYEIIIKDDEKAGF